jgi:DNA-binding winged helix-turn-helix (wHTH) protein/predicted ATPase
MLRFGRFRLDPLQGLARGAHEIHLTPKALSVLSMLTARAGHVVTKDELFATVWPETAVSDSALTTCIQELRNALGDDARRPRYIATVHRRGFRFVADVEVLAGAGATAAVPAGRPDEALIGRDDVLQSMRAALAAAQTGERQVVFLSGPAGVGKSAVIEAFLASAASGGYRVAGAGCVEQYGASEAYRPLLEALTRLCRQPDGARFIAVLAQCAPTWLAQLPSVQTPAQFAALQRRTAGVTRDRMLRELTDAVETLTVDVPLVLWLEDLHWADTSTLDWISAFAQRPDRARVMVIGTFRPADGPSGVPGLSSVVDGLRVKGSCRQIALEGLDERAFVQLVTARHPPEDGAVTAVQQLASSVRSHTEGNPLFGLNVLADLTARGIFVRQDGRWSTRGDPSEVILGVPDDVRRVIEGQLIRLNPEVREVLQIASVVGVACSAAAVAAGAQRDVALVESTLSELARQLRFLTEAGTEEWPDGTVSGRFIFLHSLYREVLHAGLSPVRRAELHARVGLRLEAGHAAHPEPVATELAAHFEQGRDARRAVIYLLQAGRTAVRRSALAEAGRNFARALKLVDSLPASKERDEHELALRIGMGGVLMATRGWGAPEVEAVYLRASELCRKLGDVPEVFPALWGLWLFYWGRGSIERARELADNLLSLARQLNDPALLLQAYHALWATSFSLGEMRAVHHYAAEGIALYVRDQHFALAPSYGNHDAAVCARAFDGRALALLGDLDAATRSSDTAIALGRQLGHAFTLALALVFAAGVHQFRRNAAMAARYAAEAVALCREHSFPLVLAWALTLEGWAAVETAATDAGMGLIEDGLTRARATGSEQFRPHLLGLAAAAHLRRGSLLEGLACVEEALSVARRTGERFYEAELHRLDGELRLAMSIEDSREGEAAFQRAIDLAQSQETQLFVLRAAVKLAQLRHGRPGFEPLRRVLEEACAMVRGDPALPDLHEAAEILGRG